MGHCGKFAEATAADWVTSYGPVKIVNDFRNMGKI
jgi:hypothetical protein